MSNVILDEAGSCAVLCAASGVEAPRGVRDGDAGEGDRLVGWTVGGRSGLGVAVGWGRVDAV